MLSQREREYLSGKEEFGVKWGLPYVRVLRQRIKKKAARAIKDLVLIAQQDEDFEEIERKTRKWAVYKSLKGEGSGYFDKKELAKYILNPPKMQGGKARRLIAPADIEELVLTACISYPISGDVAGELIIRANERMKYWRNIRMKYRR